MEDVVNREMGNSGVIPAKKCFFPSVRYEVPKIQEKGAFDSKETERHLGSDGRESFFCMKTSCFVYAKMLQSSKERQESLVLLSDGICEKNTIALETTRKIDTTGGKDDEQSPCRFVVRYRY